MLQREQGKDKALRIDLAYHRQRTWMDVARLVAVATACLLSTTYAIWILLLAETQWDIPAGSRAAHLSTGPLALVHASFENDCQRCHADTTGVSLARDSWLTDPKQRVQLLEEKCQNCHVVGQHEREKLAQPELDSDCSRCHVDHQGRKHLLAAIDQKTCTGCHQDLRSACRSGVSPQSSPSIADFSVQSHGILPLQAGDSPPQPQFRSLMNDRGRVRFDHAQHLRPGQVDPGRKGGFQLNMLAPAQQAVYRRPGDQDDSLVQLDCASCHQPFSLQTSNSKLQREEAAFYAPIDFERHCAACHQLTFSGQDINDLPLPHVAQRQEFAKLLAAKQKRGAVPGGIRVAGDQNGAANAPPQFLFSDAPEKLGESQLDAAVRAVFQRCQQCHLEPDLQPEVIASALAGTLAPLIPQRWLRQGSFSHAAHRAIERCAYCHPMPSKPGPAQDQEQVMILGPESCVDCHRPPERTTPAALDTADERLAQFGSIHQPTWASDQCTQCHRYHAVIHSSTATRSSQVTP